MTILVSDAMTKPVRSVPPSMTLLELERVLIGSKFGGAPVVEAGELVGVVSRSDIVRRLLCAEGYREYAVFEHRATIAGIGIPLGELWPSAEGGLDTRMETQLSSLRVSDIMAKHPVTVPADMPLQSAGRVMLEKHIHRIIVVEGRKPVGVLTALDIVRCYCGPTE
jgi:CBS domain-containing protein